MQDRDSTLRMDNRYTSDMVHHKEVEGVLYKYDLSVENKPLQFKNQLMIIDDEVDMQTPMLNLFDELEIDKESSYEQYVIKVNQTYNNEVDMYGDIKKAGTASLQVRDFTFTSLN